MGQQAAVTGNPNFMPQDKKVIAEARALQACIQVTADPVGQNRLWNRYYKLSDEVFPEAAVLHQRYKSLEGAERQRFKTEYMELVRRLWAATDPQAAYPVSFSETPAMAPTAALKMSCWMSTAISRPLPGWSSRWARARDEPPKALPISTMTSGFSVQSNS